ncbi:MAG: hypothetical protein U1E29_18310 [Coriobacteriia bacterium]|nr:hypothetical protein [Coriobacteriia bacterium]
MTYLAVESLDLTGSEYRAHSLSLPAPEMLSAAQEAAVSGLRVSGPVDDLAAYSLGVDCIGATEALAEASLLVLSRTVRQHRAKLYWRSRDDGVLLYTIVHHAQLSEGEYSKCDRSGGLITASLSLVCDDAWTRVDGTDISGNITAPGTLDVTVSHGDRPALVLFKAVSDTSGNTAICVGRKLDPMEDYDPIDTIAAPAAVNLTTAYAALAAAPALDTAANEGPHIVVPRVTTSAVAPSSTLYRARLSVTGSGIATVITATHDPAPGIGAGYRWTPLPGTANIPCGGVPGIATGVGYASESVITQNTVDDGTGTFASEVSAGASRIYLRQSFPAFDGLLTAFEYTIDAAPGSTMHPGFPQLALYRLRGGVYTLTMTIDIPGTVGTHKVSVASPADILASDTVFADLMFYSDGPAYTVGLARSNGDYAGGALSTPIGSGESAGDDLTFKVYGRRPLGFDSALAMQAKCSESSKTATLSHVGRLPADGFAAVYPAAYAAAEGILIDDSDPMRSTPLAYICAAAAGTAGPMVSPTMFAGSPRPEPGVNRYIVLADGTVTVSGTYWPRYSHAAAESL